jgi:hypothetical protein
MKEKQKFIIRSQKEEKPREAAGTRRTKEVTTKIFLGNFHKFYILSVNHAFFLGFYT